MGCKPCGSGYRRGHAEAPSRRHRYSIGAAPVPLLEALEAVQDVLHNPPHLFGMKWLHQVRRLTVFEKRFSRRTQGIARHEDEAGEKLRLILRQGAIEPRTIELRHAQIA